MHGAGGPYSGSNERGGGWLQVGKRGLAEFFISSPPFTLFKLRSIWVQKRQRRGLCSTAPDLPCLAAT